MLSQCPITLQQALCGFTSSVRTLDDRVLPIHETSVTPQSVKVIPGEGMPNQKVSHIKLLRIFYIVTFPLTRFFFIVCCCCFVDQGERKLKDQILNSVSY